jgi:hypothetical protein
MVATCPGTVEPLLAIAPHRERTFVGFIGGLAVWTAPLPPADNQCHDWEHGYDADDELDED